MAEKRPLDPLETAFVSTPSPKRPKKCFTKWAYFREGLLSRGLTLILLNYFCGFTLERVYYRGRAYNKVFTVYHLLGIVNTYYVFVFHSNIGIIVKCYHIYLETKLSRKMGNISPLLNSPNSNVQNDHCLF